MNKRHKNGENVFSFLLPYELEPYLLDFISQLSEQGYTPLTIKNYVDSISHLGTWLNKQSILIKNVNLEIINNFSHHHCDCPGGRRTHAISKKYVTRVQKFMLYLEHQGVLNNNFVILKKPLPISVVKFSQSLHLHGLSIQTINRYTYSINIILPMLGSDPKEYNAKRVKQIVYTLSKHYAPATLKSMTTSLRRYLRFLVIEEQCIPDLDKSVPTVAHWSLSSIPKYITAKEVEQVINSCDKKTSKGIRDRAIILLLSRLGLRAGDIVDMKLNHINWQKGILHVFGKGHREDCLPLPQDAGDVILNYIAKARPLTKSANVFLCLNAPYRPFSSSPAVSNIVASAIIRSGIKTPSSCGAHLLRHSAATKMLRSGATLETVASILRHRSLDMTSYYAKVDIPMLEKVVQPWPEDKAC